ncbi:MAG: prolyl oligopeptidase family serine peptidase [Kofleriaceae bacterium]
MHRLLVVVAVVGCSSPAKPVTAPIPDPVPANPDSPSPIPTPGPRAEVVVDTLHGIKVSDPYRWMEKRGPEFDAFLDTEGKRAAEIFANIPGRDRLRDAIRAVNRGVTRVTLLAITGPMATPRLFMFKRAPDDDQAQLWVRDGWTGKDRLLVDPRTRNAGSVHFALDYATPSPDGKHVAYGISASGSEDSVVEILEVASGKVLPEKIDRAQYAGIDWRDNTSFFYWRRRKPEATDTKADWFKNSASYLHVLGQDPEQAAPIFGPAMKELGIAVEDFTWVFATPGSAWVLAGASPGTSADLEYFVAPAKAIVPGKPIPWRRISGPKDGVSNLAVHGDTIYALTYAGAKRFRVLALDAKTGTMANAREAVPESKEVIEYLVTAADGLYLQLLDAGNSRVVRLSYDGKKRDEIKLPFTGAVYIGGDTDRPGFTFTGESWTVASATYLYEPKSGARDLGLTEKWPADFSQITAKDVEVTSKDGTKVTLSIVHPVDVKLDGSAAALVEGYSAYGGANKPFFSPIRLAWASRAVYAWCHARGNGDRGKQWHLDGTKHNKENGIDDFIACAEYLVANKYTTSAKLAVTGTSAGGVLAGGAITKRPDLYGVALLRVPMVNLVRFELTEGGPANVPEFGALGDAEDFKHLLASDPYYRIKKDTRYPAIVLTGGRHDVRVPIWIPAKFVARVRELAPGNAVVLRVETDAGHGLGSTRTQQEEEWADLYAYALWKAGVAL